MLQFNHVSEQQEKHELREEANFMKSINPIKLSGVGAAIVLVLVGVGLLSQNNISGWWWIGAAIIVFLLLVFGFLKN
ncbi:MAG: hypothetical protein ACOYZ8_02020 [Chloroflexota bacterium]